MDVDHFDPRKKSQYRQVYSNLFLTKHACNMKKGEKWPTCAQLRKGLRFLDCTHEADYNLHIFEDPNTHRVWGATPAGRWHVRYCGLNDKNLIEERAERAALLEKFAPQFAFIRKIDGEFLAVLKGLQSVLARHIPLIEYRPEPRPTFASE